LKAVLSFGQTENRQRAFWLVFKTQTDPAWSGKRLQAAFKAFLPPKEECQIKGWIRPEWTMEKRIQDRGCGPAAVGFPRSLVIVRPVCLQ
jgi:hypothetical protein